MTDRDLATRADAAAARALLLEPGECFAVQVGGDLEQTAERIDEAIERQYAAGSAMGMELPQPSEISPEVTTWRT